MRKVAAGILLGLLLFVPFFNWRLGALMWMCAWLVFILQKLFSRDEWVIKGKDEINDQEDGEENKK